jgi:hypothetical protein
MEFTKSFHDHAFALGDNVDDCVGFGDGPLGDFEGLAVGGSVGAGGREELEGVARGWAVEGVVAGGDVAVVGGVARWRVV